MKNEELEQFINDFINMETNGSCEYKYIEVASKALLCILFQKGADIHFVLASLGLAIGMACEFKSDTINIVAKALKTMATDPVSFLGNKDKLHD